ncbi:MAG: hypothetical protein AAFU60_17160, partial [Bacteroidota bacterium]
MNCSFAFAPRKPWLSACSANYSGLYRSSINNKTYLTRHPTPDTRHPTPDTRHPTPDTRHP